MNIPPFVLRFLAQSVQRAVKREKPLIVAIAGSVGKTSTTQAIGVALGAKESGMGIRVTAKSFNNELGVPLTILGVGEYPGRSVRRWATILWRSLGFWMGRQLDVEGLVLEMGSDKPGDLEGLLEIAPPTIGVITRIGEEHLEFFGTLDAVAQEESGMFRALNPGGVAIRNVDDPWTEKFLIPAGVRVVSFGYSTSATVQILEHRIELNAQSPEASGAWMAFSILGSRYEIRIQRAMGKSQAYAIAAALAVVVALDGDLDASVDRLTRQYRGAPGRTQLLPGIKHSWLIDDSYNAQPPAMMSAIEDLSNFPLAEGKSRIAVLGDMRELGDQTQNLHVYVGRWVAEKNVDRLVCCGTLGPVVAQSAIEAGMNPDMVSIIPSPADAGRFVQGKLRQGDVVLIKGSRSIGMEAVTRELMARPDFAGELLVH